MWYVLRCRAGEEQKILASLKQHLSGQILKDAFVFTYDKMKRYEGQWHVDSDRMFPNYIFLESDCERALFKELEEYRQIVQILEDSDMLKQVYPEEEAFLRFLCGKNHHLGMSRGYIKNGRAYVVEGPLKGMENRIKKIDRHKRIAKLEMPFVCVTKGNILAGLEIVEKS